MIFRISLLLGINLKMNEMKRTVYILVFALLHGSAWSQFSIHGKVIGPDGEALVGANISINETFRGTVSDKDGTYILSGLKQGKYKLKISFIGFKTSETEVDLNSDLTLDLHLEDAVYLGEEVIVKAWRAGNNAPVSHINLSKEDLEKTNLGADLPTLISLTPSIVSTSDAGTGIGYSSFRIRGTDLTRINVMVNGIPVNDAESHGVWWVDLPDISGSVENAQIQRGVGTSANGAASFGATINLQTLSLNEKPYSEINSSYGSFNSWKNTIRFGTGLINNHFAFDGRLSKITSDGYIDRSFSDLKSFFFSGGYYSAKTIIKFITFSGYERTYQAWNGIPKAKLNNDPAGMQTYVTANGLDAADSSNLYNSGRRTYNLYTYPNQTDNYQQDNFQLHFSHEFSHSLFLTLALHYTHGKGYYEEFAKAQNFTNYNLSNLYVGSDSAIQYGMKVPAGYFENGVVTKTDLIRQKWLDNDFYGTVFSLNYIRNKAEWTLGGAWNNYIGNSFGNVIWSRFGGSPDMNYEWYSGLGKKNDFNVFLKNSTRLGQNLNLYVDMQYRHIGYTISGDADKLRSISQAHYFNFFNPKLGLNYTPGDHQLLSFNFGIAHREPTRSNYTDADPARPAPVAEMLLNYELAYQLSLNTVQLGINFYFMNYKNQLVLTGQINDVGAPVMTNVDKSYRAGVELVAQWKILDNLNFNANATFSRNKVLNFTEYVDNWDNYSDQKVNKLGNTDLSFSPSFVGAALIDWQVSKNIDLALQNKYVGSQFIDNTSSTDRMLNAFYVSNLLIQYTIYSTWAKEFKIKGMINNLFNAQYESNAWVYRFYSNSEYQSIDGYFPQAGINFMLGVTLGF
jgi:iron complex outermembrane receptor protein